MHIFSVGATIAKLWVLHGFAVCSHSMRSALVKQINELCCQPWLSPVLKSQGCYIYIYVIFFDQWLQKFVPFTVIVLGR